MYFPLRDGVEMYPTEDDETPIPEIGTDVWWQGRLLNANVKDFAFKPSFLVKRNDKIPPACIKRLHMSLFLPDDVPVSSCKSHLKLDDSSLLKLFLQDYQSFELISMTSL